jgi:hypothetical protein
MLTYAEICGQASENEYQLLQVKGAIEEERAKKELLQVQTDNSNARSEMEGLAGEGCLRVQTYIYIHMEGRPGR